MLKLITNSWNFHLQSNLRNCSSTLKIWGISNLSIVYMTKSLIRLVLLQIICLKSKIKFYIISVCLTHYFIPECSVKFHYAWTCFLQIQSCETLTGDWWYEGLYIRTEEYYGFLECKMSRNRRGSVQGSITQLVA